MSWAIALKERLSVLTLAESSPPPRLLSSVLIPVGWNAQKNDNELVLMKRTMTVGFHKGQVSFPGGVREPVDVSSLETALRESNEEIGLLPSAVQILGNLSPVKTRNEVRIDPWVGQISLPYVFTLNRTEVDRLIFLPLKRLIEEGLHTVSIPMERFEVKSDGILVEGEMVWGATARMLKEFREILLSLAATRDISGPI